MTENSAESHGINHQFGPFTGVTAIVIKYGGIAAVAGSLLLIALFIGMQVISNV